MTDSTENTGTTPTTSQNNTGNTPAGTTKPTQDQASTTDKKEGTPNDQKERKDAEGKNTPDPARTTAQENTSNSGKQEGAK